MEILGVLLPPHAVKQKVEKERIAYPARMRDRGDTEARIDRMSVTSDASSLIEQALHLPGIRCALASTG